MDDVVPNLPHLQVLLNTLAACLCGMGYYFIRKQNRSAHRACMIGALSLSAMFLVVYLIYHLQVGYTPFAGQGLVRPLYFMVLASHVILAALIVPMVATTLVYALRGNFIRHRRLARWTLPFWLYVSVTGVFNYLLVFHVYST
jgi:putative membrane protein